MDWDILIRGATVFDGTGAGPQRQDVAIAGGRIAARAAGLDPARAQEVHEADGHWLIPGMLDIHTHFDLEVELASGLPEAVRHGSTTVVVANCSLGLAYGNQRRDGQDPIVDCFARVENIPKAILQKVADKAVWRTSRAYLEHLDGLALGPNLVPLIPHSMLRIEVMGLQESIERNPDGDELARMEALLTQGMEEGYAGFSTDALPFHYLANRPNERKRIPGQYGSPKELKRLTDIVRRYDRVWQATPPKDSPLQVIRTFGLTSRLAGRGKPLRVTAVAALDIVSNRSIVQLGERLSRALNAPGIGGHFRLQALPAPFKTWAAGPITPLAEEIPELRRLNEPDLEDRAAREAIMADPDWQAAFLAMWRKGKRGLSAARLKRLRSREEFAISRDLDHMRVERCPVPAWQGHTLGQVYRRLRAYQQSGAGTLDGDERAAFEAAPDPIGDDAAFMLWVLQRFDTDLVWSIVSANDNEAVIKRLITNPLMLPGFNDSGAHLTNMAFYDGNLRALKIAQKDGLAAVGRMVYRLTREPAAFFNIAAGSIDPGDQADLVLIDPARLAAYDPDASVVWHHRPEFDAEQLVNRPEGVVQAVWVAGRSLIAEGEPTAALGREACGRPLRARNHRVQAAAAE